MSVGFVRRKIHEEIRAHHIIRRRKRVSEVETPLLLLRGVLEKGGGSSLGKPKFSTGKVLAIGKKQRKVFFKRKIQQIFCRLQKEYP